LQAAVRGDAGNRRALVDTIQEAVQIAVGAARGRSALVADALILGIDNTVLVGVANGAARRGHADLHHALIVRIHDAVRVAVTHGAAVRQRAGLERALIALVGDAVSIGVLGPLRRTTKDQVGARERFDVVRIFARAPLIGDAVANVEAHRQIMGHVDLGASAEVKRRVGVIARDVVANRPVSDTGGGKRHDAPVRQLRHRLGAGREHRHPLVGVALGYRHHALHLASEERERIVAATKPDLDGGLLERRQRLDRRRKTGRDHRGATKAVVVGDEERPDEEPDLDQIGLRLVAMQVVVRGPRVRLRRVSLTHLCGLSLEDCRLRSTDGAAHLPRRRGCLRHLCARDGREQAG
jgi:hypothetical protein